MGNCKFKLSNLIPNALFYKLKNMTKKSRNPKPKKKQSSSPSQNPNYSHLNRVNKICNSPRNPKAIDTHFPDPPRKSHRKSRKSIYKPTSSVSSKQSNTLDFPSPKFDSINDMASWSSSSATDIIIDTFNLFDKMPERNLPPILTKSAKTVKQNKKKSEKETTKGGAKSGSCSNGARYRGISPRLAKKKVKGHGVVKRGGGEGGERLCESFVMVKSSLDPEKDFRESMVEMIVENNIRASKDLEELLACYLLLNSDEYHYLIVKAFEQIWFSMPHPTI